MNVSAWCIRNPIPSVLLFIMLTLAERSSRCNSLGWFILMARTVDAERLLTKSQSLTFQHSEL